MVLTQKESSLLTDLQTQEQVCVDKYRRYGEQACDQQLKTLFSSLEANERKHLDTINQMMSGTVPALAAGGHAKPAPAVQPSGCDPQSKQADGYLCKDALSTEKHVSSVYDTCVFEFTDQNARDMLNHIQEEEQQHGKRIYDYMAANGLY